MSLALTLNLLSCINPLQPNSGNFKWNNFICSDEGLMLKMAGLKLSTVAKLRYQLSWSDQITSWTPIQVAQRDIKWGVGSLIFWNASNGLVVMFLWKTWYLWQCFLSTHQKRDFADLAKVNPLKVWFHHDVNSDMYCLIIGYLEVICALVLYSAPRPLKFLGIVILLIIMAMIMQGLYWLGKPAVVFVPGAVSSILLVINFITLLAEAPPKQKKREWFTNVECVLIMA